MSATVILAGNRVSVKIANATYNFVLAAYADLVEAGDVTGPTMTEETGFDSFDRRVLVTGGTRRLGDRARGKKLRRPLSVSQPAKAILLVFYEHMVRELCCSIEPGTMDEFTRLVHKTVRLFECRLRTGRIERYLGAQDHLDCGKIMRHARGQSFTAASFKRANNCTETFIAFLKCIARRVAAWLAENPRTTLNDTTMRIVLREFADLAGSEGLFTALQTDLDLWGTAAATLTQSRLFELSERALHAAGESEETPSVASDDAASVASADDTASVASADDTASVVSDDVSVVSDDASVASADDTASVAPDDTASVVSDDGADTGAPDEAELAFLVGEIGINPIEVGRAQAALTMAD